MKELKQWVEFTKKYPPAEIFYQSNKQKPERRCQDICEELFTFEPTNSNHPAAKLRLMWQSWRDLEVIIKLGYEQMKRFEVTTASLVFIQSATNAIRVLEDVYKKDNQLWQHYQTGRLSAKDIKELVFKEINRE
ncbi:hypothetical protein CHUUTOTORO_02610 [Serratia phage vB_SmaM-ChuuTotoro]|nr:hypothetical protein CHUUTOTORO_02610 [Serratia phage vB_SmaM-ChuuTotoro]